MTLSPCEGARWGHEHERRGRAAGGAGAGGEPDGSLIDGDARTVGHHDQRDEDFELILDGAAVAGLAGQRGLEDGQDHAIALPVGAGRGVDASSTLVLAPAASGSQGVLRLEWSRIADPVELRGLSLPESVAGARSKVLPSEFYLEE